MGDLAADPDRDLTLRYLALSIVERIFLKLSEPEIAKDVVEQIGNSGFASGVISLAGEADALKKLGLPPTLRFKLVIQPMGENAAALAIGPDGYAFIQVFVLPSNARDLARRHPQEFYQQLYAVLSERPDFLLHEVIHLLDHLRSASEFKFMAAGPRPTHRLSDEERVGSVTAYINNPVEFNAHFQQAIFEAVVLLERMTPPQVSRVKKDFRHFVELLDQTMAFQTLRATEGKWAKKLSQRLWQAWETFRETDRL